MKKFFLTLLGLFLLIGGGLFSACGNQSVTLELSQNSISIEILNQNDPDGGYAVVTAEVFGATDSSVIASADGYENIIEVSQGSVTNGRTQITVRGITEGYAELKVTTNQAGISKIVGVDVYSVVSAMEQKREEVGAKSKNFVVRGKEDNILDEERLIEFSPSIKSKREIVWALGENVDKNFVSLEGNVLSVDENYTDDSITLIAKTEKNIQTEIILPVLDKIDDNVSLYYGTESTSGFSRVTEETKIKVVPNVPTDEEYEMFVYVDYAGDLDVDVVVLDEQNKKSSDIEITRQGEYNNYPLFKLKAAKNNLNADYKIFFTIGYQDYDYKFELSKVDVSVREKVNKIKISHIVKGDVLIDDLNERTIEAYSSYSADYGYGEELFVRVLPTTVLGKYGTYTITLGGVGKDSVELYYKNTSTNTYDKITTLEEISYETIYVKAASAIAARQSAKLTFTSDDNDEISSSFDVNLIPSASQSDFDNLEADLKINSTLSNSEVTKTIDLTLVGQTTMDGIYIKNESDHVTISGPTYKGRDLDYNSVTFSIQVKLNSDSFGITANDRYYILHKNGMKKEGKIDIFLPLNDAAVVYDTTNPSNSVTYFSYTEDIYNENGETGVSNIFSLENVMLKNNTTTPVFFRYNSSNGNDAVAEVKVGFCDDLTKEGALQIINEAFPAGAYPTPSEYIEYSDSTLKTKAVGKTYAVFKFTGEDVNGELYSLYRVVSVESYISPDGLRVSPQSDKQVNLYSADTVSSEEQSETKKEITIRFDNVGITYKDVSNFEFVSTTKDSNDNPIMGIQMVSGDNITWENGRYSISNIVIDDFSIKFTINALTTNGDYVFNDELNVHYILKDGSKKIYDIFTRIDISIKNAQRVEKLVWVNEKNEISFRIGDANPYYMLFSENPKDAKNLNLTGIVTDENGEASQKLTIENTFSSIMTVNLASSLREGLNGFVYVLPQDAVFGGYIKYFIDTETDAREEGLIELSTLGQYYSYIINNNAYFISNKSLNVSEKVYFKDIIVRVKVTIEDGKSFSTAYKVYSVADFETFNAQTMQKEFNPNLYYTVMRNLDLSSFDKISDFKGGLQGYTNDIVLTIDKPFVETNNGTIQNVTFNGNVVGKAFVAETNNKTISNVTIDTKGTYASILSCTDTNNFVGGIAGINAGTITSSNVLGLTITASDCIVGGVAGQNSGMISDCKVEFYNLQTGENTYGANTYSGSTVDAIVGAGAAAENSIAIKYANESGSVLVGGTTGNEPNYIAPTQVSQENFKTAKNNQGYYKSVEVDIANAIFFNYQLKNNLSQLSESEQRDLDELNTIELADLLDNSVQNIIVSSDKPNIVSVNRTTLTIKGTGDVEITLYSKQDVSSNRTITVKVLNAVNDLKIVRSGNVREIENGDVVSLQKTKTFTFEVDYSLSSIVLGNLANRFDIVLCGYDLKATSNKINMSVVNGDPITANEFSISSSAGDDAIVIVNFIGNDDYTTALNNVFERNFIVSPTDGVIEFNLSENELPITPSTNGSISVQIRTTASNDTIEPVIKYNGQELEKINSDGNVIKYLYQGDEILVVKKFESERPGNLNGNIYTYMDEINFAVASGYRITKEMDFEVYFLSDSGSKSLSFTLSVSTQNFTSIDMANIKILSSHYDNSGNTVHELGAPTSTLSPGTSSVLRINVNPQSAYYDYMELTYSGVDVLDGVLLEKLKQNDENGKEFIRTTQGVDFIGSALRYTPDEFESSVYFRIWVNTTVAKNTVIKFTATFFNSQSEEITHANYFLTVSYLQEPKIEIDGQKTAFVAMGSTAEVLISVLKDQILVPGSLGISGAISGIQLSQPVDNGIDEERGIRTYTAYLNISVKAKAENDVVNIYGTVSRTLNGNLETKTTVATAKLVDFKIDVDNIFINDSYDSKYSVWLGVPKVMSVNYDLIPENYTYDHSDAESIEAVNNLLNARKDFLVNQTYRNDTNKFYINYEKENNEMVEKTVYDRLFYVSGNDAISIKAANSALKFDYNETTKTLSVTGKEIGASVNLKLETYVYADNIRMVYSTYFTINVVSYSDEDVPLTIKNAEQFLRNLKPSQNSQTQVRNNYILVGDILLENYEAFDTSLIKSLDGNGYTIFIKSFNVQPSDSTTLNLALFRNVDKETSLKNIRVNLYNGGQLTIDKSVYKNINVAGLAIQNEGLIYNSEVVSYYTDELVQDVSSLFKPSCDLHSLPSGINIKYIHGQNTSESDYIRDGSNWTTRVAGFVLENSGSIINSRVGGDEITIIGADNVSSNNKPEGTTNAKVQTLGKFYINGQGNMAGFVLENSGAIAASFAKNIDMRNDSKTNSYYVSGFVGRNMSSIITSYVEGVQVDFDPTDIEDNFDGFVKLGSSLKSTDGYIAGFVFNNIGQIKNSYSNILISNNSENQDVYLSSGFVYNNDNSGSLYNCYSASQILNSRYSQMNFSGVDENGNLLNNGSYTNCYYFDADFASEDDNYDNSTESQFETGAIMIGNPKLASNFYGFAFASANETDDGIWLLDEGYGISLIEPNNIAISHRYLSYVDVDPDKISSETIYGHDEDGYYLLPYSELIYQDLSRKNTTLGSPINPILITDAESFVEVTGASDSVYIKEYYDSNEIRGNYRVVGDINLLDLSDSNGDIPSLPSTTKSFKGVLRGNGFTISDLSVNSNRENRSFGLFASINGGKITNLNLEIINIGAGTSSMVGGLAGYAKNAKIIGINVDFKNDGQVEGLNLVGGLVGAIFDNTILKNVVVNNAKVIANKNTMEKPFDATSIYAFRTDISKGSDYSYAGGVVGYVDYYSGDLSSQNFSYSGKINYSITNIKSCGQSYVRGAVAGGLFGLVSYSTFVQDAGIVITGTTEENNSRIIATSYYAGGIVGQSFGALDRVFARHEDEVQTEIEENMGNFYRGTTTVERGATNIFFTEDGSFTQTHIGGLIGFAHSGMLTRSYSKLNVIGLTSQYAGGVIGGIDVSEANPYTYNLDSGENKKDVQTAYILFEVYATGDIRASQFAGGIVGQIKSSNTSKKLKLFAVNALNYISNYDYSNKTFVDLGQGETTNISASFKINLIVGEFLNKTQENEWEVVSPSVLDGTVDAYKSFIDFETKVNEPTVGFYESYSFTSDKDIEVNIFGKISNDVKNGTNPLYTSTPRRVFAIEKIQKFIGGESGHFYTQNAFLNADIWEINNWIHYSNKIFPEIRYNDSPNVIYLDAYNVDKTFRQMNDANSFTKVIVRGLKSEGSEEFVDINLTDKDYEKISSFGGALIGSSSYRTNAGEQVKIITDKNFISSVAPGFNTRNLIVQYTTTEQSITMEKGLFIDDVVESANIKNLHLIINKSVKVENSEAGENFGLLAPAIINSSLKGVTIEYNSSSDSQSILMFDENSNISTTKVNIGLIAGLLKQTSSVEIKRVENINLIAQNNANLSISISETNSNVYNVGGYFGSVEKEALYGYVQDIKLFISDLSCNMSISDIINNDANLNIGGYIGEASNLSNLNILPQNGSASINISHIARVTGNNNVNINTLNHGLIVGNLNTDSSISLSGIASNVSGGLYTNEKISIKNLNAGGIYGITSGGDVSISNFSSVQYEVAGLGANNSITKHGLDVNTFNKNYDDEKLVKVTNANVGVVVGDVQSGFSFNGGNNTKLNSTRKDGNSNNSPDNSFRLEVSGAANIGSVAGLVETNASRVAIGGNITSDLQVLAVEPNDKDATLNFGGAVGQISSGNPNVTLGSTNNTISYSGGVFSNMKTVDFGGLLGLFNESNSNSGSLELRNANFSGALKVFGENSNDGSVYAGGVVGHTKSSQTSQNSSLTIIGNRLYGDVFVEYGGSLNTLTSYYFGGIIGYVESTISNLVVGGNGQDYNASAMTSHNARYEDKNATAHALFGKGVSSSGIANNYYSHSVVLLTDDFGIDCGYTEAYNGVIQGYKPNDSHVPDTSESIIKKLTRIDYSSGSGDGTKLSPAKITNSTLNASKKFNGITYYYLDEITGNTALTNTENVAIIGDGIEHEYSYDEYRQNVFAPIDTLSGYSFVSSVLLNVDINVDSEANAGSNYAGLVKEMTGNSILYASQVKGKIEVGGANKLNISGLVGKLTAGKISSCSTDVDIVYRAAAQGSAYGVAQMGDGDVFNRIIENTYSAGSIKTYIDANIHAFTQGSANSHINNSFTTTRIFWDDYTVKTKSHNSTVITAFGSGSILTDLTDCYYDSNALDLYNCGVTISGGGTAKTTNEITNSLMNTNNSNNPWTQTANDFNFNYGYPTLKIGYLKVSSYATRDDFENTNIDNYDSYVNEYTYMRLPNNTTNNTTDASAYFMLVNKGVVTQIAYQTGANGWNFILPYNINTTSMFVDDSATPAYSWTFTGNFDGCGNTISGLTSRFFGNIVGHESTSDVRNIRITDFSVTSAGILANTIENATISNLVVQGNMTVSNGFTELTVSSTANTTSSNSGEESLDINNIDAFMDDSNAGTSVSLKVGGAIANTISGSEINTTTNMTQFNVTASDGVYVGGFVGQSESTNFLYCSNYGNINVETSTQSEDYIAGGLVGSAGNGTEISYSYNVASIISGYTSSASANYYAGGLVGKGTATITNSYNSGMIKAGNKLNGATINGSVNGTAYAAGIIAYGENVSIDNCFNEGTIEALGLNPTWEFQWSGTKGDKVNYGYNGTESGRGNEEFYKYSDTTLSLVQISSRNVWAYGIGYVENSSSLGNVSQNNENYNVSQNNENYIDVYNNGSYRTDEDKIIASYDNIAFTKGDISDKEISTMINTDEAGHNTFGNKVKLEIESLNDIQGVYVKSYNSLGIPNSFSVKTSKCVTYDYSYYYRGFLLSSKWTKLFSEGFIIDNYIDLQYKNSISDYLGQEEQQKDSLIMNVGNNDSCDLDKSSLRSKEEAPFPATLKIGDKQYYMVDSNNSTAIFNAGVYMFEEEFTFTDLAYVNDISSYEVKCLNENSAPSEVVAKIMSINKNGNDGIKLKIRFTSGSEITHSVLSKIEVICNYKFEDTIDLSNLKYVYIDDSSYGILLGSPLDKIDNLQYKGASIGSYSQILKASINEAGDYKEVSKNIITEENYSNYFVYNAETQTYIQATDASQDKYFERNPVGDYVYFCYDSNNNRLVYIPNAELTGREGGRVNPFESQNEKNLLSWVSDAEHFKASIDWLSKQTLYFRTKGNLSESIDVSLDGVSLDGQDTTKLFEIDKDDKSVSGSLGYGKDAGVSVSASDMSSEHKITLTVPSGTNEDIIVVCGGNPIFAYDADSSGDKWAVGSNNDVTLGGYTFNLSIVNDVPTLICTDSSTGAIASSITGAISTYLKFYSNDWTSSVSGNYSLNGREISTQDDNIKVTYNEIVDSSISGESTDGNFVLSTNNDLTYTVKFKNNPSKTGLTSYTIGDVTVFKGSANFDITHNYFIKITNVYLSATLAGNYYRLPKSSDYAVGIAGSDGTSVGVNKVLEADQNKFNYQVELYKTFNLKSEESSFDSNDEHEFDLWLNKDDEYINVSGDLVNKSLSNINAIQYIPVTNSTYSSFYVELYGEYVRASGGVVPNTNYYQFTQVTLDVGEDLSDLEYYEYDNTNDKYTKTNDSSVVADKNYYELNEPYRYFDSYSGYYVDDSDTDENLIYRAYDSTKDANAFVYYQFTQVTLDVGEDPSDLGYYEYDNANDIYTKTNDSSVVADKNYYKLSAYSKYYMKKLVVNGTKIGAEGEVLYSTDHLAVYIPGFNVVTEGLGDSKSSTKNYVYDWKNSLTMPNYSPVEAKPDKKIGDSGFEWVVKVGDDNYNNKCYITSDENSVIITMKNATEVKVTLNVKDGNKSSGFINLILPQASVLAISAWDIILMDDISFNDETSFEKHRDVNIVGNGYYLSYFGESLYDTMEIEDGNYIRDLKLLAETTSSVLTKTATKSLWNIIWGIITGDSPKITLKNLSIYGTVNNFDNNATNSVLIGNNQSELTLDKVSLYLNVNSKRAEQNLNILPNIESISDITNYGVIVAKDGTDGALVTEKSGNDGEYGGGIKAYINYPQNNNNSTLMMENKGIIKAGKGGNGSGGADRHDASTSDLAYAGGAAGINGTANGFSGVTTDSITVKEGLSGAIMYKMGELKGYGNVSYKNDKTLFKYSRLFVPLLYGKVKTFKYIISGDDLEKDYILIKFYEIHILTGSGAYYYDIYPSDYEEYNVTERTEFITLMKQIYTYIAKAPNSATKLMEIAGGGYSFTTNNADWYVIGEANILNYYELVENPSGNPKNKGWFEFKNRSYMLTEDEDVVGNKQYYETRYFVKNYEDDQFMGYKKGIFEQNQTYYLITELTNYTPSTSTTQNSNNNPTTYYTF